MYTKVYRCGYGRPHLRIRDYLKIYLKMECKCLSLASTQPMNDCILSRFSTRCKFGTWKSSSTLEPISNDSGRTYFVVIFAAFGYLNLELI